MNSEIIDIDVFAQNTEQEKRTNNIIGIIAAEFQHCFLIQYLLHEDF